MNPLEPTTPLSANHDFQVVNSKQLTSSEVADRVSLKTWELMDDQISESDLEQLNRDLESSVEARLAYVEALTMHVDLMQLFGNQDSDLRATGS